MGLQRKQVLEKIGIYVVFIILLIFFLAPLISTFIFSIMTEIELRTWPPPLFPSYPSFARYNWIFTGALPAAEEVIESNQRGVFSS